MSSTQQGGQYSYILMEDVDGEKAPGKIGGLTGNLPKHVRVICGELLTSIPQRERVLRNDGKPAHNYRSKKDPSVTLYGGEDGWLVAPLNSKDLELLEAIERPGDRFTEFSKPDKLEWGGSLGRGDQVYVKIPSPNVSVPVWSIGLVRYVGPVKGLLGSNFGIEIKVNISGKPIQSQSLVSCHRPHPV